MKKIIIAISILTIILAGMIYFYIKKSSSTQIPEGQMESNLDMQAGGDMQGSSTGSITLSATYAVDGKTEETDGKTYSATESNKSAVLVENGGDLTLTNSTLEKTGDSTNVDESNFYGLNGILVATASSKANLSNVKLTSSAEGANAVFATGEKAVITVDNVTINTTGNSSRGLDATYGGTINATNVDITTAGAHSATLATDRGEGTITVDGGTLSASGDGSPCIYSTGNITVKNVTGVATGSQMAVVEGKNSINISNSTLTGTGLNGIMLYQSTSGDANVGTAEFYATDSTLKTTSTGPMFYVTNTTAEATLTNTNLDFSSGILANISGNSTNNWGTPGSNGGNFTLKGINQILNGDITCDNISTFILQLTEGSTFTGAINTENIAKTISLSLDDSSTWNVTGDSYITSLTNTITDCTNIISNGYNIYYDSSNSTNSWLNGKTISLNGGGSLIPVNK